MADAAGAVVASLVLLTNPDDDEDEPAFARIALIEVLAEHRRKGVGRALVEFAKTFALKKGCERLTADLLCDQAEPFWKALKFESCGCGSTWSVDFGEPKKQPVKRKRARKAVKVDDQ